MPVYSSLVVIHAIFTTLGYVGLIATNACLLLFIRDGEAPALRTAIGTWRRAVRIFGPVLGLGILAGFALAVTMGFSLVAGWLVATYVIVAIVMAAQAAVMVPWQFRAEAAIEEGAPISTRPVVLVLSLGCLAYIAILTLMLLRP